MSKKNLIYAVGVLGTTDIEFNSVKYIGEVIPEGFKKVISMPPKSSKNLSMVYVEYHRNRYIDSNGDVVYNKTPKCIVHHVIERIVSTLHGAVELDHIVVFDKIRRKTDDTIFESEFKSFLEQKVEIDGNIYYYTNDNVEFGDWYLYKMANTEGEIIWKLAKSTCSMEDSCRTKYKVKQELSMNIEGNLFILTKDWIDGFNKGNIILRGHKDSSVENRGTEYFNMTHEMNSINNSGLSAYGDGLGYGTNVFLMKKATKEDIEFVGNFFKTKLGNEK